VIQRVASASNAATRAELRGVALLVACDVAPTVVTRVWHVLLLSIINTLSLNHFRTLIRLFRTKGERNLHPRVSISHYPMSKPSTPPSSQNTAIISAISDTTPLKRDLPGSEAHTSTPTKRASGRYLDMTFDICNKFVGPMPVKDFLEEFVPHALTPRPQDEFPFHKPRVSQNENEFVGLLSADTRTR